MKKKLLAAVLSAAMAASLLAGCSSSTKNPEACIALMKYFTDDTAQKLSLIHI